MQKLITICVAFLLLSGSQESKSQSKSASTEDKYSIEKRFDAESATYYYLTRINHKDKDGNIIKLKHAHSNEENGETVREFAQRLNCTLAFNASTQYSPKPDTRKPNGVQIIDGEIIQDRKSTAYTLGIKENNELVAYKPQVKAQDILKDGSKNALTAFAPLIEKSKPVSEEVLAIRENFSVKHPRQIIAQYDNLDIVFLSCGGRGFDGEGMNAKDVIRILQGLKVRFAFMLDGGGSTSVVEKGRLITVKIDEKGTKERKRPNFLYID